jgi:hypothetical protein
VGVALSPVPLIVLILLLFSKRATANSLAFLVGWVAGLAIVSGIVLALAQPDAAPVHGSQAVFRSVARLTIGAVLLFLAYCQWRKRPAEGPKAEMPRWMNSIDSMVVLRPTVRGRISNLSVSGLYVRATLKRDARYVCKHIQRARIRIARGRYRVEPGYVVPGEHTTMRADLADFLVRALDDPLWEHQAVAIASPGAQRVVASNPMRCAAAGVTVATGFGLAWRGAKRRSRGR